MTGCEVAESKPSRRQFSLRLSEEQYARVERAADARGVAKAQVIVEAVKSGLKALEKETKR